MSLYFWHPNILILKTNSSKGSVIWKFSYFLFVLFSFFPFLKFSFSFWFQRPNIVSAVRSHNWGMLQLISTKGQQSLVPGIKKSLASQQRMEYHCVFIYRLLFFSSPGGTESQSNRSMGLPRTCPQLMTKLLMISGNNRDMD